jgi:hypothetical protein
MSNQDPNITAAQYRAAEIDTQIAAAQADLKAYQLNQDTQSAAGAIQQIADLTAQRENLVSLYNSYVNSQQPQYQQPLSKEELEALPPEKMHYGHVYEMLKGSAKHGIDDNLFRAGMAEVRRRRATGER